MVVMEAVVVVVVVTVVDVCMQRYGCPHAIIWSKLNTRMHADQLTVCFCWLFTVCVLSLIHI